MVQSLVLWQLESVIDQQPVDEVIVALPRERYGALIESVVGLCEEQGLTVRVQSALFKLKIARWQPDELDGRPMVTIRSGPSNEWHLMVKRLIDICVSATLLLGLAPLLAIVTVLITLDSPGPALFRQERVGRHRRRFKCLKFRTMTETADQMQQALEHLNETTGPAFKIKNDPRITRLGKILRHFSIDELPQLFNVLKGDMSLVGPRPLPVRDVERFQAQWHKRRFSVRPGLTCIWQVSGRSALSFDDWVSMDLAYTDKWSLALDGKILLQTVPAVLRGSGAY
jgi:exopolysaccharide biosynthesis polyprenyl glycosylphosphotransferase